MLAKWSNDMWDILLATKEEARQAGSVQIYPTSYGLYGHPECDCEY